jgi:hypothetical protein
MLMPKAAMDENSISARSIRDVWRAWQGAYMKAKTRTETV